MRFLSTLPLVCGLLLIRFVELSAQDENDSKFVKPQLVGKYDDLLKLIKNSKAKIVFLNVWSIGCSPCMAEMPVLVNAAGVQYKESPDVAFIALCLGDEKAKPKANLEVCEKIVQKKAVPYPTLLWAGSLDELRKHFDIQATPYNAILTTDGQLLGELELPSDPQRAAAALTASIEKALLKAGGAKADAEHSSK